MGFLKLYRPLLFYLCALVCRKCCREFNGQLYGEPVRLEWNKPRLRRENCWPCTSWTLLGPALYRVNGGGTANGPVNGRPGGFSRHQQKAWTRRYVPKQPAVRSGDLQLSDVDRARAKARGVVPSDVSLDSHDSRKWGEKSNPYMRPVVLRWPLKYSIVLSVPLPLPEFPPDPNT